MKPDRQAQRLGPGTGRIKWFSAEKGYGFISMDDGRECFVHKTQCTATFREGDEIAFELYDGARGLHARKVIPLSEYAL